MAQKYNKVEMDILCKWNGNFRSVQLEGEKFPLNSRVPSAFQPVEPKIFANWKVPMKTILKFKVTMEPRLITTQFVRQRHDAANAHCLHGKMTNKSQSDLKLYLIRDFKIILPAVFLCCSSFWHLFLVILIFLS